MSKRMYTIKDLKAESFSFPFESQNNATAIRDFSTLVKDGRTLIGQHPEDFELYFIGWFNDDGSIVTDPFHDIARGSDFITSVSVS